MVTYAQEAGAFVLTAVVGHSQAVNEEPLKVWIIAKPDGIVLSSHCTCKAGLSEVCSHVTAVLFAMEACCKHKDHTKPTCTDLPCSWLDPRSTRSNIQYAKVCDIDFSRPLKKMKLQTTAKKPSMTKPLPPAPNEEERNIFYQGLQGSKSAILSLIPPFSESFVPKSMFLPEPVTKNYSCDNLGKEYSELVQMSLDLFPRLSLNSEQAAVIEENTRLQSKSKIWFDQRSGRITASVMKSAAHTDPHRPSVSLIKRVCYPEAYSFSTKATRWGCEHEETARQSYQAAMTAKHEDLQVEDSGFCISTEMPFIGASPDGKIRCNCCGQGVLEIKCPHCKKDKRLEEAAEDKNFYLQAESDGKFSLKTDHAYYYQVQAQLYVTKASYCDFVVWLPNTLFIQRVRPDATFFQDLLKKVTVFYKICVLPEVLGKWYTRQPLAHHNALSPAPSTAEQAVWCYCRSADTQKTMVECQSGLCKIQKFHISCLGFKSVPKRKWSCLECRKLSKSQKN